jgi:hypothetical protein
MGMLSVDGTLLAEQPRRELVSPNPAIRPKEPISSGGEFEPDICSCQPKYPNRIDCGSTDRGNAHKAR